MTRQTREIADSGVYHIMLRGNERKNIFREDEDKQRFLDGIAAKQMEMRFSVYANCLMDNHVHLLMKVNNDQLASLMKGIAVRYVSFYNWKYKRVGHVFRDRFKSEAIEDEQNIRTLAEGKAYLTAHLKQNTPGLRIRQIIDDKARRKEIILHLINETGLSQRMIAELLEVDKGVVERAKAKNNEAREPSPCLGFLLNQLVPDLSTDLVYLILSKLSSFVPRINCLNTGVPSDIVRKLCRILSIIVPYLSTASEELSTARPRQYFIRFNS